MHKNLWKRFKDSFKTPKIEEIDSSVTSFNMSYIHDDELKSKYHKANVETIGRESLRIQYESQQKNLVIMHRTMIIALIGILVSMTLGIIAVAAKPDVKIEMYDRESTQLAD